MNMAQLHLLNISQYQSDIVYTPDAVAADMVSFFAPLGKCLDPCLGDGAFFKHLPGGSEWCEIEQGKNFFEYHKPVDWIIGNPPYAVFSDWLRHSFSIAANVVYLIPINKAFNSFTMLQTIYQYGGIKHIRAYAGGSKLGFPIGFAVGAVHFQRDYGGDIGFSFYPVPL